MPVRWNTLKVSQAVDRVEEQVNQARPFLEMAKEEARKALTIPNLPQYIEVEVRSLAGQCASAIWRIETDIGRIRRDIPQDDLARAQKMGDPLFPEAQQLPEKICDDGTIAVDEQ